MRVGEITGLRWCDIDLEEEIISVNHTLVYYSTRTEEGQIFAINTPKTKAGERIIPMLQKSTRRTFSWKNSIKKNVVSKMLRLLMDIGILYLSIALEMYSIKEHLTRHREESFVIVIMRCLIKTVVMMQ